jgi:hypothetical protein
MQDRLHVRAAEVTRLATTVSNLDQAEALISVDKGAPRHARLAHGHVSDGGRSAARQLTDCLEAPDC